MKKLLTSLFSTVLVSSVSFSQWTESLTQASYHLYSVEAVTNDLVFAGGYGGSLVRTTDGGDTWDLLSIGNSNWIKKIHFMDENTGWLVNHPQNLTVKGEILKTTDGGDTWTSMDNSYSYSSLVWPSNTVGYAGTWQGVIVKTTDGGNTWSPLTTPSTASETNIPYLFFVNELVGFGADTGGRFYRTYDGGNTWELFNHYGIHQFYFFNQNDGYCVDDIGRIGKTTDGGQTFTYWQSPHALSKLEDIYFVNSSVGYAVGGLYCAGGTCTTIPIILHTNDGGATWIDDTNHPFVGQERGFYAVDVTPNGMPFLAGSDRYVLKNEAFAGVQVGEMNEFSIYPNPATTEIQVELTEQLVGGKLSVTNVYGQTVNEMVVDNAHLTLSIEGFASGVYFIKTDDSRTLGKFVKN